MNPDSSSFSFPLFAAGLLGLVGVGLGAFGAHGLKPLLTERGMLAAWETASRYHLFHAVTLLGLAAWARQDAVPARWVRSAAVCWCAGIVLFSGSLYWLAVGGPRWLGPVTPIGGVALMAGWLLVMIAAFRRTR